MSKNNFARRLSIMGSCNAALHVAVLFEYPTLNGGEYSFLSMVPTLQDKGVKLTAIAPDEGPLSEALAALHIPTVPWFPTGQDRTSPAPQSDWRQRLTEVLPGLAPDLVHANSVSTSRRLGPVARALDLPSLGHLRDIVGLSRQARHDIQCLNRLLAVSQATKEWHVQQGLEAERIHVLYNGVDVRKFTPRPRTGALQQELGISADARLVGCVGQLGIRKGTDIVLVAARQLAAEFPQVHWVIVGERHSTKPEAVEYCRRLEHLAGDAGLNGRVHFLGRRGDMPSVFGQLSLLVHAARQEPLGRILLEAAATGLPIVATRVGGTEEIFGAWEPACSHGPADPPATDAASGDRRPRPAALLVEPDDVAGTVAACRQLLAHPLLASALGGEARMQMASQFDVAKKASELFAHYRDLSRVASRQHQWG